MSKTRSLADRADSVKAWAESTLRMSPKGISFATARRDAPLVHSNVREVAEACLRGAMVYARYDANYLAAKQYCNRGAEYADTLVELAELGLNDTPWSGFFVLHCCLMAGKFRKADMAARWMLQCPPVAENDADPHDPLSMLSAYGVLDMRAEFESYRRKYFDTSWHSTHPFFGPLVVYLDLWHSILTRDQVAFDAAMVRREEHHVRLSKQRGEGRIGFGGGEDSLTIVDFMGIGCAIVARKRGMSCDVDTTYLPKAMVDMAFASDAN